VRKFFARGVACLLLEGLCAVLEEGMSFSEADLIAICMRGGGVDSTHPVVLRGQKTNHQHRLSVGVMKECGHRDVDRNELGAYWFHTLLVFESLACWLGYHHKL
jgi:hypothetical protein